MDIHALDIIFYFIILIILWTVIFPSDWKEEIGVLAGLIASLVYTVIYMIIFFFLNWSDIFNSLKTSVNINW